MSTSQDHIIYLWNRFVAKTATKQELDELFIYLQQTGNDNTSLELIQKYLGSNTIEEIDREYWLNKAGEITEENTGIVHRVHFLKTAWFRYAAAILIIAGIGAYLWNINSKVKTEDTKIANTNTIKEILPGGQRALLTLADGSTIELDSASNGQLATQGSSKIIKLEDGQLVYSAKPPIPSRGGVVSPDGETGVGSVQRATNTMSTPRGGQYQLTLSDGTKVFLNAASSITYPAVFNNKTREVKITGEVYFDVSKDPSKPFIVKSGSDQLTVLGTAFNINNYPDEISKTSLIEGAVKINDQTLKPGQAYSQGKLTTTNIQQDIAWMKGYFDFNGADLPSVMRQLSRWYNIEIKYSGKIPDVKFVGKLSRDLNLSQVLETLNDMGIKYSIERTTLTIK
ncbi:MAG: FecR family protein [Chitinophagaceae bacterium]|nr:FecR family protein [Chitinophagaceae bacterium]